MLAADIAAATASEFLQPLAAEGETTPIVRYKVDVLAPGTNTPLTTVINGHDFDLRVTVQDLRFDGNRNRGSYAAYLDLLYDKSLAKVRVFEVQRLDLNFDAPETGFFTLTLNPGQTTAPINYSNADDLGRLNLAISMQTALNNLLGPNSVTVSLPVPSVASYEIQFTGLADVDQPDLKPSALATVTELVKGDPALPSSYKEAFRSRGGTAGAPGKYQAGLSALNAVDRIDELGAQIDGVGAPIGNGIFEVVRARMTATLSAGQQTRVLTFTPDFSQLVLPEHQTLVYADFAKVPPESQFVTTDQITSAPTNLTIQQALNAASGAALVDEDNAAGVDIPILPLVSKSAGAPAGSIELRDFSQPVVGGTVQRLDPNNTPTDRSDDLVKFIPATNFSGTATFTYKVGIVGDPLPSDEATSTITVTVNPVNDAPQNGVPPAQSTPEDTPLIFSAANGNLLTVTDVDADPAGVRVNLAVSTGTLTLSSTTGLNFTLGTGTANAIMTFTGTTTDVNAALAGLKYQPPENFTGPATLTITTNDLVAGGSGGLKQDQDSVSITVTGVNDAPQVAAPGAQTAFTLNAFVFSPALGNGIVISDADAQTDPILVTVTAAGGIGTLTATAAANAQVTGNGTASLTITGPLSAVNAALNGLVLTPPTTAASGTLTIVADDQGHNPGPAKTGQAVVAVAVSVPAGPFAVNDTPAGLLEGSASYTIDVLANDLATSGNKAVIVSFTQPLIGNVALNNNGTPADPTDDKLVYTPPLKNGQPDLDFFTPASLPPIVFTYVANQSPAAGADSPPGTVSLRINNDPDPPTANNDGLNNSYATSIGVPMSRTAAQGILANDTSPDNAYGDPSVAEFSVSGATAGNPLVLATAAGGSVTVNVDGSFTYTPLPAFGGNDTFTYRAKSSLGPESNQATVTLHVSAPPTAGNDSYTQAQEDQPFISPVSVLFNDSDLTDGETLAAVLVTNVPAAAGSVTLGSDGIFTYNPALNFNTTSPPASPIQFTYKVRTPNGRESTPATVSITVNETNDNPTANGDSFDAVQQIGQLGLNQLVNVTNNDSIAPDANEFLTVTAVNGVAADVSGNTAPVPTTGNGSVRLENFQIKYNSPTATGNDSFTYTISDGRGGTSTATVQVTVLPPYDYGDAPDTYGTLVFSNGARHFAIGPKLGALRDEEANGVSSPDADGDDLAGQDDEDGLGNYLILRGKSSSLSVQVDSAAKLDAWIDFDKNGTFDAAEKIAASVAVAAGANQIPFDTPAAAAIGRTFARLRVSTAGGLGPTGTANDGEVEDYLVTVLQDLEVTLPTGNGLDRASVRKSGTDVQVFNNITANVLGTSPLEFTHAVIVHGAATEPDEIIVDYSAGGLFSVPGNIHLDGGASGNDTALLVGAPGGNNTAQYHAGATSLGNASLTVTDGTTSSNVDLIGMEPLTIQFMTDFQAPAQFNVGADVLTLSLAAPANLGPAATIAGGTINAPGGIALIAGQKLSGEGTINAPIAAAAGSTIEATGPLIIGDATSSTGFVTAGELKIGANNVTLQSTGQAALGSLTSLGSGNAGGTLAAPNGLSLAAGNIIQGLGTIDTPNDPAKTLQNAGTIQGNSAAQKLTLSGFVTGTGILDNVIITGTFSPGNSPAAVQLGSVSFAASSTLVLEIGGPAAGNQYDQLNFSGAAVLGGTLKASFVNGYAPATGDGFDVINTAAGITGNFAAQTLPALAAKQRWWDTTPTSTNLQLFVSPTLPRHNPKPGVARHDVNDDGFIVAGDALDIINYINAFGSGQLPPSKTYLKPFLDVGGNGGEGDNFVAPGDALDIINLINAGQNHIPPEEGEAPDLLPSANASPAMTTPDLLTVLAYDLADQATHRRKN